MLLPKHLVSSSRQDNDAASVVEAASNDIEDEKSVIVETKLQDAPNHAQQNIKVLSYEFIFNPSTARVDQLYWN